MSKLEEIRTAVENGRPKHVESLVLEALDQGISPAAILEEAMIPAMRDAGEYYRRNESDIPRILAAARSMRKGLDVLEPRLDQQAPRYLGKVIIGTVQGDLHDVGKNLVAIMFRSVGFEVIDLGVDVTAKQFLNAVREHPDVSIICLSSLLTTSKGAMRRVVRMLKEAKDLRQLVIMVGGGSVTEEFAREIGADAYTNTAVDAAQMAKHLVEEERRNQG